MARPIIYNSGVRYNTPGAVYNGVLPDTQTLNKRKTTMLTQTELFGFADEVTEAMDTNSTALAAEGVTTASWKTNGQTLKNSAVQQAGLERDAKAALKDQTTATQTALQAVYDHYSSKLDAMAGAFGKTTAKGKALLRIRSKIRRGPNNPPTPPAAAK